MVAYERGELNEPRSALLQVSVATVTEPLSVAAAEQQPSATVAVELADIAVLVQLEHSEIVKEVCVEHIRPNYRSRTRPPVELRAELRVLAIMVRLP